MERSAECKGELFELGVYVDVLLVSIVNVLTWLIFEASDVERGIVVLESSILSVLIIGVDWLVTAKLSFDIDVECPDNIVVFLPCCERLNVKVLGKIRDVDISLVSIVNVLTWLIFEASDVERDIVVLESSILSVLIIGVDWLVTAKLSFDIDVGCLDNIVVFLLCCERLNAKVLGKIRDVDISPVSIVNVLTWLIFEAGDAKRDIVVLESSILSVLIIGVDWLVTAKLSVDIDADCPDNIVVFLLCCERLKVKVLGNITDVCEVLTDFEIPSSSDVPAGVLGNTRDCETKLAFSDNVLVDTELAVEVAFNNNNDCVGIADENALLLDINEADNSNEVTFKLMPLNVLLPWVDVTTVKFRATKLADSETFVASVKEIRVEVLLAAAVEFKGTETYCLEM